MSGQYAAALIAALFVAGLFVPGALPVSAQMGPEMMGRQGMMGQGQTSAMPMQQMSEVMRQMADRLASGKALDAERAERLRRLVDQLAAATTRMSGGMGGGMMGGGMMGQGPDQMAEVSRILAQISDLLRSQ